MGRKRTLVVGLTTRGQLLEVEPDGTTNALASSRPASCSAAIWFFGLHTRLPGMFDPMTTSRRHTSFEPSTITSGWETGAGAAAGAGQQAEPSP